MTKVFITGGAGFIGSHLADAYVKQGQEVVALDDLSTGREENVAQLSATGKFRLVKGSVLDPQKVDELMRACDICYHLAAAVGVYTIVEKPLNSLLTNLKGTEVVLEAAARYGKKILIASTSEVYGKSNKFPFSETDDAVMGATDKSRWSYAYAKAVDEFMALAYYQEKKLPVIVVRFFNTVGPRQTGRYGMVIPNFVRQALLNEDITIFGDGHQSRCFIYVGDVVEAVMRLMDTPAAVGQVINVGNNSLEISIEDLARQILKLTGSRSQLTYIPYAQAYPLGFEDMERRIPDLFKIKALINFQPKVQLTEILQMVIEHKKTKLGDLYKY
ncbi:nucleoside-diphosphate sugar epimerase [Candidatus Termititenax persephonae]|uniref:Nucleoside-diphosphate sugar epimerase n=1 Tax=Candidatus Termititenax persephonae TaxID=2218525 RepID=A0A388TIN0_9BACT|nr:nucleoside-diphosphate sugar epimerase [Candidatus Termititenax persephonae]